MKQAEEVNAGDDELGQLLRRLQRLIVRYPFAAQALYSGLLAEGRRFAETESGQDWKRRLRGSELLRQSRPVWDVTTLNVLEDDAEAIVPSKLLEAFVQASSQQPLEQHLRALLDELLSPEPADADLP